MFFLFLDAGRLNRCFYMFLPGFYFVGSVHGQRATRQINVLAKVWREPGDGIPIPPAIYGDLFPPGTVTSNGTLVILPKMAETFRWRIYDRLPRYVYILSIIWISIQSRSTCYYITCLCISIHIWYVGKRNSTYQALILIPRIIHEIRERLWKSIIFSRGWSSELFAWQQSESTLGCFMRCLAGGVQDFLSVFKPWSMEKWSNLTLIFQKSGSATTCGTF